MRNYLAVLIFSIIVSVSSSQTVSSPKIDSIVPVKKHLGISLFGGMGVGGNTTGDYQGFSYGFDARVSYGFQTADMFMTHCKEYLAIGAGHDGYSVFDSYNYGLMYGAGLYGKYCYINGTLGFGYTKTILVPYTLNSNIYAYGMPDKISFPGPHSFPALTYTQPIACLGAQAGAHTRYVGFSCKSNFNVTPGGLVTYTVLFGMEFFFK